MDTSVDNLGGFDVLEGWLLIDDLGRSGITDVNFSVGQLKGKFLSGYGHTRYLTIHASVSLVYGKGGTA
jgi:hypothetical protein